MKKHNEIVRCIHFLLCKKYGFKKTNKIRSHSVQEVMSNDNAEIRVDTSVLTDIKFCHNKPDILVIDKKNKEILNVEIGITNQDLLTIFENEILRKYDLLANELGQIYKSRTKIIPYYHRKYIKELEIQPNLEAYMQSIVLKKTGMTLENLEAKLKINETKKPRDNQSEEYEYEIVLNNSKIENT
ncbi:reverse transcriptase [Vairimorpha apis BRL 01]|uniref:Reverse transcriptase n=1 Tax=Vairimorpha apis BRL 01 TaxID=1037528 RepID=T0MCQ2_9MICR|nr:reverse transcriptase [Vairimorpha apis BRL 01]